MSNILSLAAQADLITEYLKTNPKLDWAAMQAWTVPSPFEQEDWAYLLDNLNIEIFKEAQTGMKITGYPTTAIKDIRTQHDRKPIAVVGKVIALSDVEPDPESVQYVCDNCGESTPSTKGEIPKKCGCGGDNLEPDLANAKNMQVYRLQDGNIMMSAVAKDDSLLYASKAGQSVYTFGILKHRKVKERDQERYRKYLELTHIESKNSNDIHLSNEDIDRFNELAKDPMHYQILVESWAPHLHGLIEQKELCLIVTASKGIKRPLNGFLGGPPATGKTELIIFSTKITPNGQFVNTMNMTMAGLTSAAVQDPETGTLVTRAGMLAMADGDVAGITEFQAVRPNEKVGLNDVLERKEVAGSKADGTIKLSARCAVLIDSNNYAGRWDYNLSLAENLKFLHPNTGAFLSRMDLISITERITDKEMIRAIAKTNYSASTDKEDPLEQFMDDYEIDGIPHYGINTLRKYIAYVTSMPLPTLDLSLADKFADNFEEAHEHNGDFLVDGRYNRSIITIAKVRARLLLKPQVDESDLLEAIRMVNRSKDIETKTADGRDSGVLVGVKDKQKLNQEETLWNVYNGCFTKHKEYWKDREQEIEYASQGEMEYELSQTHKWPDSKARREIGKLVKAGLLLESFGQGKLVKA